MNEIVSGQIVRGEVIEAGEIIRRDEGRSYMPIVSRVAINIRPGTMDDLPFIDALQKKQSREVGFLPLKAIEGKIRLGQVLVAEARDEGTKARRHEGVTEVAGAGVCTDSSPTDHHSVPSCLGASVPVGYLIAADRYFKRDEIGYITQINVSPEYRRSLVAASLLQAQFDRSAYGCRLYCCWCAQDLKANEFWEAMGFTAIAFRTGSRKKGRHGGRPPAAREPNAQRHEGKDENSHSVPSCLRASVPSARIHIFWQKRVRADDTGDVRNGGTPWWYPSQTSGGEMREDRLVFPIPPDVSWRDVLPVVLTESDQATERPSDEGQKKARRKKVLKAPPHKKGGLWFAHEAVAQSVETHAIEKVAPKKPAIDPRVTKMARELRDRWMESQSQMILPGPEMPTKYDVRKTIAADDQTQREIAAASRIETGGATGGATGLLEAA